jgi:hypothetical protein
VHPDHAPGGAHSRAVKSAAAEIIFAADFPLKIGGSDSQKRRLFAAVAKTSAAAILAV